MTYYIIIMTTVYKYYEFDVNYIIIARKFNTEIEIVSLVSLSETTCNNWHSYLCPTPKLGQKHQQQL